MVNTYSEAQETLKRHSPHRPRKSYTSRLGAKSYSNNLQVCVCVYVWVYVHVCVCMCV